MSAATAELPPPGSWWCPATRQQKGEPRSGMGVGYLIAASSTSIQCRTGVAEGAVEALDQGDAVGREARVAAGAQVTVR